MIPLRLVIDTNIVVSAALKAALSSCKMVIAEVERCLLQSGSQSKI
jgi:predicted nucleic acid-binding protein